MAKQKMAIPKDLISAHAAGPKALAAYIKDQVARDAAEKTVDTVATVITPIFSDKATKIVKQPKKTASKGANLSKLAAVREAYFKKMGYGKYAKATKKTAKQVRQEKVLPKAKKKPSKAVNAQLAKARDAYFRKMKFGKYAPKSKKA